MASAQQAPESKPVPPTAAASAPAAAASTAPAPSPSAPGGAASGTQLESVTVTAQKRTQLLDDVPLSIQAFTGADLQRAGVAELGELIRYIPGASLGISNSYGFQSYQIRSTGTVSGDSTVGYYLDDAAFSLIGSNIAPVGRTFDVNRVEVLRGPQGTLYGLSALGGAIRFITADPNLDRIEAKTQAGYSLASGGDPGYFGDVALSVPFIQGKLGGRVAIDYEKKGGYIKVTDFPGQDNLDPTRIQNYRGKLLWQQPDGSVLARLTVQHNEVKQDFGTLLVTADPPVGTQGTGAGLGGINTKYDLVSGFVSVDLGPGRIESSTGQLTYRLDQIAYINIGGPVQAHQTGKEPTFTEELRYVSNPGGKLDYVVGAFYLHAKDDTGITLTGAYNFSSASTYRADTKALFGEVSTNLMNGKIVPLIGGRVSWDGRKTDASGTEQEATFRSFTPRFNLAWLPSRDQTYFINIARGFRGGQFNNPALVTLAQGFNVPAQNAVSPDSIWSYEIGAKGNVLAGMVAYDLALYHTVWKDVQLTAAPQPGLGVTVNGGKAVGTGLDYGFSVVPVRGVTVSLTGNFNNTRLRDVPSYVANSSPTDGIYDGARMPYSPANTQTLALSVDRPVVAAWRFIGYAAYNHTAGQNQANSGLYSDSVNLVSARLGGRNDKLAMVLFSDNLTNRAPRTYNEYGLVNRPYPRTVGVQVNYDY